MSARPGRVATALLAALTAVVPSAGAGAASRPSGLGAPSALTVDDLAAPVGLGLTDVYFGWHDNDRRQDASQTSYRIVVSAPSLAGPNRGGSTTVWDSGRVASAEQAFVPYAGPPLKPDTTYSWTVQTWDRDGQPSPTSARATFDTGLRDQDWHADWIKRLTVEPQDTPDTFAYQSAFGVWEVKDEYSYVRKETQLAPSPIVRARAYVSADHSYELYVNGTMAAKGQAYNYPDSQYYETTDITSLVHAGQDNAFGLIYNWEGPGKGRPPGEPGVIAQISILHADGSSDRISTDGTWRVLAGAWLPGTQRDQEGDPVDYTENINGLLEPVGWDRPGFDDRPWTPATVIGPHPTAPWTHLVPVRTRLVYEPVHPVSLTKLASGSYVADFGKVYAAIPSVTFRQGLPGRLITMHGGYLLDPSGQASTTHGTQHTDMSYSYILRGGTETFRSFDYLGFRYFQIDNPGVLLTTADVVALTRHDAVPDEHAATFSSSDPTVDAEFQLGRHSALYSMQEQFVDTPTREKGSWLWDGRNGSLTAMDAFGEQNLARKDLLEFAQSQARFWPSGAINKIYPTALGALDIPEFTEIYPEWVWQYWIHTGDRAFLTEVYPVVSRVSDFIHRAINSRTGLVTDLQGTSNFPLYSTDTVLNVLAANVFQRVGDMATALGRPASESATQAQRRAALVAAINTRLERADGRYIDGISGSGVAATSEGQTANAFALEFGVVPAAQVAGVGAYVASLGMATPPMSAGDMLEGLAAAGRTADIVRILTSRGTPGWANVLARGGTFTWEVWQPSDANGDSMSHGWGSNVLVEIQQWLLGVRPTGPGFETFDVSPPTSGLMHATGTVPTPRGTVTVTWERAAPDGPVTTMDIVVPPNAIATVTLPGLDPQSVTEAWVPVHQAAGVTVGPTSAGASVLRVGSGSYALSGSPTRS